MKNSGNLKVTTHTGPAGSYDKLAELLASRLVQDTREGAA
jgi:hypothetical protein